MAPARNASSSPRGKRADRGLRGAHIGAHRDVHADKARGAGQDGADRKADGDQPAEEIADDQEDHDADDGDGRVLPLEIGLRALADRRGDLLHLFAAGIGRQHRARGPDGVGDRQYAAKNDEPQSLHGKSPVYWRARLQGRPARKAPRIQCRGVWRKSARTLPKLPPPRNAGAQKQSRSRDAPSHPSHAQATRKKASQKKGGGAPTGALCLWSRIVGCGSGLSAARSPLGAPPRLSPEALP